MCVSVCRCMYVCVSVCVCVCVCVWCMCVCSNISEGFDTLPYPFSLISSWLGVRLI